MKAKAKTCSLQQKNIIVFKANTKETMSKVHEVNELLKAAESELLEEKSRHLDAIRREVNQVEKKIEALIAKASAMEKPPLKDMLPNLRGILLLLDKIK
jgi:uncharacterized membrane protein YjjP (DUF1212 family)